MPPDSERAILQQLIGRLISGESSDVRAILGANPLFEGAPFGNLQVNKGKVRDLANQVFEYTSPRSPWHASVTSLGSRRQVRKELRREAFNNIVMPVRHTGIELDQARFRGQLEMTLDERSHMGRAVGIMKAEEKRRVTKLRQIAKQFRKIGKLRGGSGPLIGVMLMMSVMHALSQGEFEEA